ncbi:MAG: right-handed parallel beta-helix repeat-containing protein [Verrucomicrobiales bacterium]|nr:right-handed parallel beta-helix repeat-containing protein [Verrucomicrobiales bacterium]
MNIQATKLYRTFLITTILFVLGMTELTLAQQLVIDDERPWSNASISYTTRASSDIFQNDIETLIPLASIGNGFVFTNIAYNTRDNGNTNFSGGIGFRFEIPALNAIGGIRTHLDITETQHSNQVEQLGLGIDLYTALGIDFHGNLYFADEQNQFIGYGNLFAQQHSILQNVFGEQGRSGGDVRIAAPVPLVNNFIPTRAHVGGYFYDGEFMPDLSGIMAGIEMSPFAGVKIGAEYYADKEFFGENVIFTAGVSIPLDNIFNPRELGRGLAGIFQSRNTEESNRFFDLASRAGRSAPRRNWVMTEAGISETKTILSDVIFVNNGGAVGNGILAGSAGGNGTAERPVDTIQGGAGALVTQLGGSGTVYVQAGTYASAADQNIEVGFGDGAGVSNVVFTSSFKPVAGCGGLNFGGDTGLAIVNNGGFDLRGGATGSVTSATIQGFEIVSGLGGAGNGIAISNVENVIINCNTIRNTGDSGISFLAGNFAGSITDNIIADNSQYGIRIYDADNNGLISGNTITGSSSNAIHFNNGVNNGSITSNTISGNVGSAIHMGNGDNTGVIAGNTITANMGQGIFLHNGDNTGQIAGNTIIGNENGIFLNNGENSGRISGNIIADSTEYGIDMANADNSGFISGNTITGSTENGIHFNAGTNSGSISGNTISNNTGSAIHMNQGANTGFIANNSITDNGGQGIYMHDANNTGTISGNTISRNLNGIYLNNGNNTGSISGNTITGNRQIGILLDNGVNQGTIDSNIVTDNFGSGLDILNSNTGFVTNNTFNGNTNQGAFIFTNNGTISRNSFSDNGLNGLLMVTNAGMGIVDANTANGNTENGFRFFNPNAGTFTNNSANNNTMNGYLGVGGGGISNSGNTGSGNAGGNTP